MRIKIVKKLPTGRYDLWLKQNKLSNKRIDYLSSRLANFNVKISILTTKSRTFDDQIYAPYEVCTANPEGDYIAFLFGDDELEPDALAEVALAIKNTDAKIIYTDEDRFLNGRRYAPFFKPDWSPELLLSFNYIGNLLVISKDLYLKTDPWDLILKATEQTNKIHHIPRILYHVNGQNQLIKNDKPLIDALHRRNINASTHSPDWNTSLNSYNLKFPDTGPLVTIIIKQNNEDYLRSLKKTSYKNYIISTDGKADTEYVLYLDSDLEVVEASWLSDMVGYAQMEGVGSVGARIINTDFTLYHAGVNCSGEDIVNSFNGLNMIDSSYFMFSWLARNCCELSSSCLLVKNKNGRKVYCPTALLMRHNLEEEEYKHVEDPYYNPNFVIEYENGRFFTHQLVPKVISYKDMKPIKTAVLVPDAEFDDETTHEIVNELKIRGIIDPTIISPTNHVNGLIDANLMDPDFAAQTYMRLLKGFELVYASNILTYPGIMAAKWLEIPSIWNIQESQPILQLLARNYTTTKDVTQTLSLPYRVIFGSRATREAYEDFNFAKNFTVIHNIQQINKTDRNDAREKLGLTDEFVILCAEKICEIKSQNNIIEAISLFDIFQNIKCFLVGDVQEEYCEKLKSKLKNSPTRKLIKIIEQTNDDIYYAAADVYVSSSKVECFPKTILKAIAYELPIIAIDTFGINEAITHGHNGFLVEKSNKNISYQIYKYLLSLYENTNMRKEMGKNKVSLPTFDMNIKMYTEIFREASLLS